jgi:hypothetical protein
MCGFMSGTSKIILLLCILFSNSLVAASDTTMPDIDSVKKYFEWGDYDKLIETLEPYCANPSDTGGTFRAECFKYLGVAHFSRGRIGDARTDFASAYRLNQQVTLDPYYVTKPILDFFNDAVAQSRESMRQDYQRDSVVTANDRRLRENQNTLQRMELKRLYRSDVALSSIAFSLAVVGGFLAWEYHGQAEENYVKFLDASSQGDKVRAERLSGEIKMQDGLHTGMVVASAVFLVPGTYFIIKAMRIKGKIKAVPTVSGLHGPAGYELVLEF